MRGTAVICLADPARSSTLSGLLRNLEFEVHPCAGLDQLPVVAEQLGASVIVTDSRAGGVEPEDLIRRVRATSLLGAVLILVGDGGEADDEEALRRAGATALISPPVEARLADLLEDLFPESTDPTLDGAPAISPDELEAPIIPDPELLDGEPPVLPTLASMTAVDDGAPYPTPDQQVPPSEVPTYPDLPSGAPPPPSASSSEPAPAMHPPAPPEALDSVDIIGDPDDELTPLPSDALSLLRRQVDEAETRLQAYTDEDLSMPVWPHNPPNADDETQVTHGAPQEAFTGDARRPAPWFDDLITASVDRRLAELLRPGGALERTIEDAVNRVVNRVLRERGLLK